MKIKRFNEGIDDNRGSSAGGIEWIGKVGPNFGDWPKYDKISKFNNIIFSDIDNKFYTNDDYIDMYNNYLKSGGKEDLKDFNKQNLEKLISLLK